ncbi:MAG: FecR domain-containing protein [Proteobacteria bacterium]|nr:FecR domain-containing protein [Pseudomonadota bacterium]
MIVGENLLSACVHLHEPARYRRQTLNRSQGVNPEPSEGQTLLGQAAAWLLRLEEAPDDRSLQAEYDAWLAQSERHREAHDAITRLWRNAEELGAHTPPPVPAEVVEPAGRRPRIPRFAWGAAVLAAGLALLFLPGIQRWFAADHSTSVAETREVELEDGSRVSLDAETSIAVAYKANQRTVTLLKGQAFFKVVPSTERPFVVSASDVKVTVTGTSFSVGEFPSGVAVEVKTGTVNVSRDGKLLAGLGVGQRAHIAPGGATVMGTVSPDEVGGWRDHRIVVYQATIRDVVEQIGRYLPATIVFRDREIANRLVTGIIDLNRPEEALRSVVEMQKGSVSNITPYLVVIFSR